MQEELDSYLFPKILLLYEMKTSFSRIGSRLEEANSEADVRYNMHKKDYVPKHRWVETAAFQ